MQAEKTISCVKLEDGRILPPFDIEALKSVPNLKLRNDDVIICCYSKSGTHWLFEIVRMLINGTVVVPVISKMDFMMEFQKNEVLDEKPSPRVLNTHYRFKDLPTDIHTVKPKIVYIRRNPKDVAVSFYNHTYKLPFYGYSGEFKNYLKLFLGNKVEYGSWFEYVKGWERICQNSDVPIIELTYEDLKKDSSKEIRKISDYLGLERNEELFEQIKDKCSFSSMQRRKGHFFTGETGNPIMYRKGEVGDWKNWFTVAENEWFDSVYQQNMKDSKLEFVYELK